MVGNSSGSLVTTFVGFRVIATNWSIMIETHRDTFVISNLTIITETFRLDTKSRRKR